RRIAGRRREIADEIRDRVLAEARKPRAIAAAVHPRAAALLRPRIEIGEKTARHHAAATNLVILDARMPHGLGRLPRDLDPEEILGEREEAGEHLRQREIASELLVRQCETLLAEPLGIERDVPRLEPSSGMLTELREVALGVGLAAPGEIAQEADDLVDRARHLRRERKLCVVLEAQ